MYTSCPLLSLVLISSVCGVNFINANSEAPVSFKESQPRMEDEQEPFITVTLSPQPDDAVSTLFGSCLADIRTFDVKIAALDGPEGKTYTRYVLPDSLSTSIPATWEDAEGNITNIFECGEAAEEGGYSMFKYSDNTCQLSVQSYNVNGFSECELEGSEIVFIGPEDPMACSLPSVKFSEFGDGTPMCFIVSESTMAASEAEDFCASMGMVPYYNKHWRVFHMTHLSAKLAELGYTENLWVGTQFDDFRLGFFSGVLFVDGVEPVDRSQPIYMDAQFEWKLRVASDTFLANALCFVQPL